MKKLYTLLIACMLSITAMAQVITNGLVAYYPFSGNANDMSGNGHNGTVNGATLTTDRFGNPNSAYLFNGTNSLITVPHNNSLNALPLTVNVWFKTNQTGPIRVFKSGKKGSTQLALLEIKNGLCSVACSIIVPQDVSISTSLPVYALFNVVAIGLYIYMSD